MKNTKKVADKSWDEAMKTFTGRQSPLKGADNVKKYAKKVEKNKK